MKKLIFFMCVIAATFTFSSCNQDEVIPNTPPEDKEERIEDTNPYRVSLNNALKAADELLFHIDGEKTRKTRLVKDVTFVTEPLTRSDQPDTLLYIVNYEGDDGFAILGADTRLASVYGISNEGSFDVSDTIYNKGLSMLMENYKRSASYSIPPTTPPYTPKDSLPFLYPPYFNPEFGEYKVTYLQKTEPKLAEYVSRWGQDRPFNNAFLIGPPSNPQYYLIGCVPLACAQVMSFFNWPDSFKGTTLNWDEILAYPAGINACPYNLSEFFKLVGETLNANYGSTQTGVYEKDLVANFHKFGYQPLDKAQPLKHREASQVLEEHPILVMGDPDNNETEKHCWVIDGYLSYKEEGGIIANPEHALYYSMFHCVWGWYGLNNGYFLCPNGESTGINPFKRDDSDIPDKVENSDKYSYINLRYWSNITPVK